MFIAGIDGGGTSAKLELRDLDGKRICRKEFGPFNLTDVGISDFRARLREIFSFCGNMADCAALCIGCAGITKMETSALIREELAETGFHGSLNLCGDYEIALRGALDGPGCILIAGTGSVAYGRNASGEKIMIGGHGHLIDDRGSGYALGRDALALTVQTLDGRKYGNRLADAVLTFLNAEDARDVVNYVYAPETGKSGIAALAPVVLRAAEDGDDSAMDILEKNADELALMARTLVCRLKFPGARIALTGGLLHAANLYRTMTVERISDFAEAIVPEHDPLTGAVMLAKEELHKSDQSSRK